MSMILTSNQIFISIYHGNIENGISIPEPNRRLKINLEKQLTNCLKVYLNHKLKINQVFSK